ncbi:hypothetical protein K2173_003347 [Erythroxylum novogranatense]|uniref:Uncharacterized protein n=1 Tax=Erythroxylum novogranatense TaxID=1862640 RepID=A0AAV8S8E1_9ROSI|nr:hypothetical protein K2173_003347 [Erythroxylum novogranatense]
MDHGILGQCPLFEQVIPELTVQEELKNSSYYLGSVVDAYTVVLKWLVEPGLDIDGGDGGNDEEEEEEEDAQDTTMEKKEIPIKRKSGTLLNKYIDQMDADFEVKKDLNALSREEQMDVVYSSAPELVGLLSKLNDTLEQPETRINPAINQCYTMTM